MGNSFAKNYDCPKEHTATAGRDDTLWRIWPGRHKETKAEASIWVYDKSDIGKKKTYPPGGSGAKQQREATAPVVDKAVVEQVLHIMKKDMLALKELTTNGTGKIVQFIELIEDAKGGVIFCTEKVICSLADIMDGFEHIPGGKAVHREYFGEECVLSEVEIARGIYNVAEGLQYLHNVVRKLHMNVSPANIMLTATGEWKLCGLGFALGMKPGESSIASPYFLRANPSTSIRLEPDLCYCAPEVTGGGYNNISNAVRSVSPSVDMFSLGVVAYELFYLLRTDAFALDVIRDPSQTQYKLIPVTNNNTINHPMALESLTNIDVSVLPPAFGPILRSLLSTNAPLRMSSADIMNSAYFTTGPLATLRNLDSLLSKDIGAQSSLLSLLPTQLTSFPSRLLENSVLIPVCKACLINPNLWTFAIPVHDYIVQYLTRFRYRSITGPFVKRAFEDAKSVEVMHVLLKNIRFFLECFSDNSEPAAGTSSKPSYIGDSIVTLFSNSLDKARHPIQILSFQLLCDPTVRHCISVHSLVSLLIPKICREACKNPDPNVKLHALYLLSLVTNCLDKQFIIENILPSLRYIIDHDKNTNVAMAVVGNYEAIADILGTEYVALAILPAIIPLMTDRTLDFKQTDTLIATATLLLKRVVDMRAAEMLPQKPTWTISLARDSQDTSAVLDPFSMVKRLLEAANQATDDGVYKSRSAALSLHSASPVPTTTGHSTSRSDVGGIVDVASSLSNGGLIQSNTGALSHSTISVNPENVNVVRVRKAVPTAGASLVTAAPVTTLNSSNSSNSSNNSNYIINTSSNNSGSKQSINNNSGSDLIGLMSSKSTVNIAASQSNVNTDHYSFMSTSQDTNLNNMKTNSNISNNTNGTGSSSSISSSSGGGGGGNDIDMSDFLQSFASKPQPSTSSNSNISSTITNNNNINNNSNLNSSSMYDFISNTSSTSDNRYPVPTSNMQKQTPSQSYDIFGGMQLNTDLINGSNNNSGNSSNSSSIASGLGPMGGINSNSYGNNNVNNNINYSNSSSGMTLSHRPIGSNMQFNNSNINNSNSNIISSMGNLNSNSSYVANSNANAMYSNNYSSNSSNNSNNIGNLKQGYMPPKY